MSEIEQFDKWVQDARRDDDYINATKWCKHFGYRLNNWKQLPETKARLAALSKELKISHSVSKEVDYTDDTERLEISHSVSKELIYTSGRGYRAVTWIHRVMAVHLASYLDPDFANYVAKTFIRYVTADPTLAADIASRQETTEGLDIINKAVQERYEFLGSKLMRAYYMIRDAWGDKLRYNTLTEEIQLNGSPLELRFLKIKLEEELHVKVTHEDARSIVKVLAIANTYPLMDAANQQRFEPTFRSFIDIRHFVPTKEYPRPQKLS
ncbi:KilA-N domain-containing protein [Nostoc sp. ChiQUE01b]|uniref:KilA-N domain-containing protein n=1 Tax=Nostoc sp. ChiQUE01b TaxID=3075376 RepID=UPI002AD1D255|nr:KilA-N domain-containing protein [Nostoc sp. ChiQUE01b]MDZ8260639.1 KilA-N domain-containing protein [Nostoc sp. ChiQUE01b]